MLSRLEQAKEQWGGHHSSIDNWLAERQDLLIQYCELAGLAPFEKSTLPTAEQIQSFFQLMVDYLSAGHFEVYKDLVSECEQRGPHCTELAEKIYPHLYKSTAELMIYNDKYDVELSDDLLETFDQELSALGEALGQHIDLEDQLIHSIYGQENTNSAVQSSQLA